MLAAAWLREPHGQLSCAERLCKTEGAILQWRRVGTPGIINEGQMSDLCEVKLQGSVPVDGEEGREGKR